MFYILWKGALVDAGNRITFSGKATEQAPTHDSAAPWARYSKTSKHVTLVQIPIQLSTIAGLMPSAIAVRGGLVEVRGTVGHRHK
jgi:hypothetical protein